MRSAGVQELQKGISNLKTALQITHHPSERCSPGTSRMAEEYSLNGKYGNHSTSQYRFNPA